LSHLNFGSHESDLVKLEEEDAKRIERLLALRQSAMSPELMLLTKHISRAQDNGALSRLTNKEGSFRITKNSKLQTNNSNS